MSRRDSGQSGLGSNSSSSSSSAVSDLSASASDGSQPPLPHDDGASGSGSVSGASAQEALDAGAASGSGSASPDIVIEEAGPDAPPAGDRLFTDGREEERAAVAAMPQCAEKILRQLILECQYCQSTGIRLVADQAVIVELFAELQPELEKDEFWSNSKVRQFVAKIKQEFNGEGHTKRLLSELQKLLHVLHPVDVMLLNTLLQENAHTAGVIEDRDVILLLGPTGSGKTTTIIKAAGGTFEPKQLHRGAVTHYEPISDSCSVDLETFKASAGSQSETRGIHALALDENTLICDTAGFDDTAGTEMDIANGIGIANAVRQCRSVKPVVLISDKGMGDRGEKVCGLFKTVASFLPSFAHHSDSFTYLFTKFPNEDGADVAGMSSRFDEIRFDLSDAQKREFGVEAFLGNVVEQTADGAFLLHPLETTREELLGLIASKPAIANPREAFTSFVSTESISELKLELEALFRDIKLAIKKTQFDRLAFRLGQLQQLHALLQLHETDVALTQATELAAGLREEALASVDQTIQRIVSTTNPGTLETFYFELIQKLNMIHALGEDRTDSFAAEKYIALMKQLFSPIRVKQDNPAQAAEALLNAQFAFKFFAMQKQVDYLKWANPEWCESHDLRSTLLEIAKTAGKTVRSVFRSCAEAADEAVNQQDFPAYIQVMRLIQRGNAAIASVKVELGDLSGQYDNVKAAFDARIQTARIAVEETLTAEAILDWVGTEFDRDAIQAVGAELNLILSAKVHTDIEPYCDFGALEAAEAFAQARLIACLASVTETVLPNILKETDPKTRVTQLGVLISVFDTLRGEHESLTLVTEVTYQAVIEAINENLVQAPLRDADHALRQLDQWTSSTRLPSLQVDFGALTNAVDTLSMLSIEFKDHPYAIAAGNLDVLSPLLQSFLEKVAVFVQEGDADHFATADAVFVAIDLMQTLPLLVSVQAALIPGDDAVDTLIAQLNKRLSAQLEVITKQFTPDPLSVTHSDLMDAFRIIHALEKADLSELTDQLAEVQELLTERCGEYHEATEEWLTDAYDAFLDEDSLTDEGAIAEDAAGVVQRLSFLYRLYAPETGADKALVEAYFGECPQLLMDEWIFDDDNKIQAFKADILARIEAFTGEPEVEAIILAQLAVINLLKPLDFIWAEDDTLSTEGNFATFELTAAHDLHAKGSSAIAELRQLARQGECERFAVQYRVHFKKPAERDALTELLPDAFVILREKMRDLKARLTLFNFVDEYSEEQFQALMQEFNALAQYPCLLPLQQLDARGGSRSDSGSDAGSEITGNWPEFVALKEAYFDQVDTLVMLLFEGIRRNDFVRVFNGVGVLSNMAQVLEACLQPALMQQDARSEDLELFGEFETILHAHQVPVEVPVRRRPPPPKSSGWSFSLPSFLGGSSSASTRTEYRLPENIKVTQAQFVKVQALRLQRFLHERIAELIGQWSRLSIFELQMTELTDCLTFLFERRETSGFCGEQYDRLKTAIVASVYTILDECGHANGIDPTILFEAIDALKPYLIEDVVNVFEEEYQRVKAKVAASESTLAKKASLLTGPDDLTGLLFHLRNAKTHASKKLCHEMILLILREQIEDYKARIQDGELCALFPELQASWKQWQQYLDLLAVWKTARSKQLSRWNSSGRWGSSGGSARASSKGFKFDHEPRRLLGSLLGSIVKVLNGPIANFKAVSQENTTEETAFIHLQEQFAFLELLFTLSQQDEQDDLDYLTLMGGLCTRQNFSRVRVQQAFGALGALFSQIHTKFDAYCQSTEPGDVVGLLILMREHHEGVVQPMKALSRQAAFADAYEDAAAAIQACPDYEAMCDQLVGVISEASVCARQVILHTASTAASANRADREQFYTTLSEAHLTLRSAQQLAGYVDSESLGQLAEFAEVIILKNLGEVQDEILRIIARIPVPQLSEYQSLNTWWDNLVLATDRLDSQRLAPAAEGMLVAVLRSFHDKLAALQEAVLASDDEHDILEKLLQLKLLAIHVPHLQGIVNQAIDQVLKTYMRNKRTGAKRISALSLLLMDPEVPHLTAARQLIADHEAFKHALIQLRNQKTLTLSVDDVLDTMERENASTEGDTAKIDNTHLNTAELKRYYEKGFGYDAEYFYHGVYWTLVQAGLPRIDAALLEIVEAWKVIKDDDDLPKDEKIVQIVAHIFAYWTLANAAQGEGDDIHSAKEHLLQPHPAQVIVIFRLLGLDRDELRDDEAINYDTTFSHLAQVLSGEGKSVAIMVTGMTLASLGYDVDCVCYSDYLVRRDEKAAFLLLKRFGLLERFRYGTFNQVCEDFLNARVNVREQGLAIIRGEPVAVTADSGSGRPRIVIGDEVDVFFDQNFYGNIYRPLAELQDPVVSDLYAYIWANKDNPSAVTAKAVCASAAFTNLCGRFPGWDDLFTECVKAMLLDLKGYQDLEYVIEGDRIGYRDQHGLTFERTYRYQTVWQYHHEESEGKITTGALAARQALLIDCGAFSFAEIPNQYVCTLGLTGTLLTLSDSQRALLRNAYGIVEASYMPTMYAGNANFDFPKDSAEGVRFADPEHHFFAITDEFLKKREKTRDGSETLRPVFIFFESTEMLMEYYRSKELQASGLKANVRLLTEDLPEAEKETIMLQATAESAITLMARSFGRGTDIRSDDKRINQAGGVHVLQTFLSEEDSEEAQIKRRTGRNGDNGSYSIVLNKADLERVGLNAENVTAMKEGTPVIFSAYDSDEDSVEEVTGRYNILNRARAECIRARNDATTEFVTEELLPDHNAGMTFRKQLLADDEVEVKKFLLERNGVQYGASEVKMVILIDGTGSMGGVHDAVRQRVSAILREARAFLDEQGGYDHVVINLQFAYYRNYNAPSGNGTDSLLSFSPFSSDAGQLTRWMNDQQANHGIYNEAVEVGLWHVNNMLAEGHEIDQVLLIGDMPPNTQAEITDARGRYNYGSHAARHYQAELGDLVDAGIPVNTFPVSSYAQESFQGIADKTGGECQFWNPKTETDKLKNLVIRRIMQAVDKDETGGLMAAYDKYVGYVSSSRGGAATPSTSGVFAGAASMSAVAGGPSTSANGPAVATGRPS